MTYQITHIQLFDYAREREIDEFGGTEIIYTYSANIIINNKFVLQVSGDSHGYVSSQDIPDSSECYWEHAEYQDSAYEEIDANELIEALESGGYENNIGWLNDQEHEIMIPENAQYRVNHN